MRCHAPCLVPSCLIHYTFSVPDTPEWRDARQMPHDRAHHRSAPMYVPCWPPYYQPLHTLESIAHPGMHFVCCAVVPCSTARATVVLMIILVSTTVLSCYQLYSLPVLSMQVALTNAETQCHSYLLWGGHPGTQGWLRVLRMHGDCYSVAQGLRCIQRCMHGM